MSGLAIGITPYHNEIIFELVHLISVLIRVMMMSSEGVSSNFNSNVYLIRGSMGIRISKKQSQSYYRLLCNSNLGHL